MGATDRCIVLAPHPVELNDRVPGWGERSSDSTSKLSSPATAGEGRQNLICAYLAAAVLAGLLANTLLGIWWLDPAVALSTTALAITEGRRAWRGESCACAACSPATRK